MRNIDTIDKRLAEWLRSNPVGDPYSRQTTCVLILYANDTENGCLRWPVISEPCRYPTDICCHRLDPYCPYS